MTSNGFDSPPGQAPPSPQQNIVLIGFMGTGKSTVGRHLAEKLGYHFVDTDDLVVQIAGQPIPEIFATGGETAFRDLESQVLQSLATRQHTVIATGGGIVTRLENAKLLRQIGFTVCLAADEDTIFNRVSKNNERPLVQTENPRQTVHDLLAARLPLYLATAHLTIDTTGLDSEEVAFGIKESASLFFSSLGQPAPGRPPRDD